jgi:hypothetical protein
MTEKEQEPAAKQYQITSKWKADIGTFPPSKLLGQEMGMIEKMEALDREMR